MSARVAAVILSAGFSSRMGAFKPLLELGGVPAVERCVNLFRRGGVEEIRVVTGHRADELTPVLERLGVASVQNLDFAEGMFSSVQAGVEGLPAVDAFFVHPVDLPLVRHSTVARLIARYRDADAAVLYPTFRGMRGHPPLLAGWMAPEIVRWSGDGGLQGYLGAWEGMARDLEVPDEQILFDMDTDEEYRTLKARAASLHVPSEMELEVLLSRIFHVEPHIAAHGRAVAEVVALLGEALVRVGIPQDIPLLTAAGYLHDLARKDEDHAHAGALKLREAGFEAVADLVATHMEIAVPQGPVTPAEILYLADKLVRGERRVSLTERFAAARECHAGDSGAQRGVAVRLEAALRIQERLEAVLGHPLAEVIKSR